MQLNMKISVVGVMVAQLPKLQVPENTSDQPVGHEQPTWQPTPVPSGSPPGQTDGVLSKDAGVVLVNPVFPPQSCMQYPWIVPLATSGVHVHAPVVPSW